MWVRSLGREDFLEEGMATHSNILAWRIPWTEEPDVLQSMGYQRVGHDWVIFTLFGTSLVFQWLSCYTSKAGGMASIPGLETKIPHAPQYGQKIFFLKYFPAGPVAKTLHSQCMGPGFDPWSGNQIPDLIPHATTKTECSQINKYWTFVVTQMVKNLPTVRETRVHSLDWEGLLEKEVATHSSILA